MTLTQAALPSRSALTTVLMVLAGSALLGLSAQATVPMLPVPMTLQTLAVSVIGLAYGSRLAAATVLAYLAEGAMGLPVFANGGFGIAALAGPTSGFLWGFVGMAWLTGWMVERGLDRAADQQVVGRRLDVVHPRVLLPEEAQGVDLDRCVGAQPLGRAFRFLHCGIDGPAAVGNQACQLVAHT